MTGIFPDIPNNHTVFALLMMAFALFLFTRRKLSLVISSIIVLSVLALVFSLFPLVVDGHLFESIDFFHGFGHEALVTVIALMVVGQGLVETGALEPFGRLLTRAWRVAPFASSLATLVISGLLSAFINNTPIVVLFLPILMSVCLRTGKHPSKILMPMGFATIVGGMSTTIGTSTNLLVVSVVADLGLPRMGMFDFFLPAMMAAVVAVLYLWLIAPLLLPETQIGLSDSSPRVFQARLHLGPDSPAVGKTVSEMKEMASDGIKLLRIKRGPAFLVPLPDVVLLEDDVLRVKDTAKKIRSAADALKARLYTGETEVDEDHPLQAEDQAVAEIAIVSGSELAGQNLGYTRFLDQHQLIVLALHRQGRDIWKPEEEITDVILEQGDILLVQGDAENIKKMKQDTHFLVLDASEEVPRTGKSPIALSILFVVVLVAALGLVPIAVSSMVGAMAMLATKSLKLDAALRAISAPVVFVVAASLAIGQSLEITGASLYITEVFLYFFAQAEPVYIVSGLMLIMGILTNIVSNNAAAVIGTPIAVNIAQQLGAPIEPFVLAVLFGANLSFATPMAYKTNLLVMNAANYSFNDFVRAGVPLTLLMWVSYTLILNYLYL